MTVYEWNGHLKIFSNRKLQAIFASPNRYFTENSRSVPLPKLYDIFFQAQPVFLHRKGEGSLLLSEFECPRAILIKQQQQQQQHHIFFIMDVPFNNQDSNKYYLFDCIDYYLFKGNTPLRLVLSVMPGTCGFPVDEHSCISFISV